MSVTAVGPALDLDGPLPVVRRHSLLLTDGVVKPVTDDHVFSGVNVYGYPEGTPFDWEPCSDGTYRTKEEGSDISLPRFDSVGIYFPLACSSLGMGDFDAWANRVQVALDATLSHGVEQALAQGVIGSTNPAFSDTNLVELAAGAVSPAVGLRYLDNAIGELTGRDGMIHTSPAVVDAWGYGNGLRDNDHLATPAGTRVVSGSGYIHIDPATKLQATGTIDWAFATGPVEVRIKDGVNITVDQALDRADNSVVYRAEKFVLATWDTALQVGVRIDWSQA